VKDLTKIDARPLKGGCITALDKALLPLGAFSYLRNIRNTHPGFLQRPGQRKLHSTPDSTNKVQSLYQYSKTLVPEKHFYAQMSDGDIWEATNLPPTVTTGAFGTVIFAGAAGQVPASWSVIRDMLLFSNGKDKHQIYGGISSTIDKFIVFRGAAAPPDVPQGGEDYTDQVMDGDDGTVAVLDSLADYTTGFDLIFFKLPVPGKSINLTVTKPNGNTATAAVYYWKSDNTWAAATMGTDGTDSGGATLAQSGTISWTAPTDMIPKYAFGVDGYWYQLRFSATLDSEVEISQVTYASDWKPIENIWDSVTVYGIEVQVEGTSQWETYAAGAVDLSELASGKKVYVAFSDPVEGIYLDPGGTPNTSGCSLSSLKYWDGAAFTTVGTPTDGTVGISQAGWITFPRKPAQPHQLHTSMYQAYWYELTWSQEIAVDTVVAFQGMPFFNINELGNSYANCVWKDRACYTFDRWGAYIYVSATNSPLALNGIDYGILKAGDGRANRVVGMRKFHNDLMVWQQELGVEGGCITIFEGYSPVTFGKLVLSTRIGSMNNNSMCVVDGVLTATKTDETIKTLAFSLSRYGVCVTDGMTVSICSDDIQNYFDPTKEECIRHGYEQEMWLAHDSAFNVIRIGLVSGPTATKCNVFPVFDLTTKTWSFDTPAQELSCATVIEPGSGQAPVVMVGGGIDDGTVYQLNYGVNDVDAAVVSTVEMVINHKATVLRLAEILVRMAAQSAGSVALSVYDNEIHKFTKQLSMAGERASNTSRRHRFSCDVTSDLMTMVLTNAAEGETMNLYEIGTFLQLWEPR